MGASEGPVRADDRRRQGQGGGADPTPVRPSASGAQRPEERRQLSRIGQRAHAPPAQLGRSAISGVRPGRRRRAGPGRAVDPGDDRADRAPSDAQQLTRRRLRGAHRQPRHHVIEVTAVADTVSRPRHRDHRGTVHAAPDPRRVGFDEHLRRARVQRPPPTPTVATVIARRSPQAPPDTTIDSSASSTRTPSTTVRANRPHKLTGDLPEASTARPTSGPRCSPAVRTTTR